MNAIPEAAAVTPLERATARSINSDAEDNDTSATFVLREAAAGEWRTRAVVLRRDAVRFFHRHETEIVALLVDCIQRRGATCADIFGDDWDSTDPLARGTTNQTTLARFGFAEAARVILERLENEQ